MKLIDKVNTNRDSDISVDYTNISNDTTGSVWSTIDPIMPTDKDSPLYGLTVGVKDLFCVKGTKTTAGSEILENFIAPYDSTVTSTIQSKGAILCAKLAMDEFAMGSFSNTSKFGKVSIPNYPNHSAGGSSGGSAAALKANLFDFTIGSDTGGSVRQPASFCGVYGYKPSYGSFSRFGMIAYASSLDQAGFFTHYLEDIEYLLDSNISIKDSKDTTCNGINLHYVDREPLITYLPELLDNPHLSDSVKIEYSKVISQYPNAIPIKLPSLNIAAVTYYVIACAEASSNLARYQGVHFGKKIVDESFTGDYYAQVAQHRSKYFGEEVRKRLMLGAYILSSENYKTIYEKSKAIRAQIKTEILTKMGDMLILPTTPYTAPTFDEISNMNPDQIWLADFLTVPFSLAGLPVINKPCDVHGLGIGMQYVGKADYQLVKDMKKC